MKRIGLIGGLSWESTASYYRLLNEFTSKEWGAWQQPTLLIDSLNFQLIVELQRAGNWSATGRLLADSARRLEAGGAEILAICANTMHVNFAEVKSAVSVPVVDVRDALVREIEGTGATSMSLLGTKYLMEMDFYSSYLEGEGIRVVKPSAEQIDDLQEIIFAELTRGIVRDESRVRFMEIANDCHSRGGEVIGLCCTEFGQLMNECHAPWPFVDTTVAHVKALLSISGSTSP